MCKDNILLQEALAALKFYANEENWVRPLNEFSSAVMNSSAMLDAGHIAKQAIIAIKKATQEGV